MGSLTLVKRSVLIGSLLGDGTLRKQGNRLNALFEVNHSFKYKLYVDWKYQVFQDYVLTQPKNRYNRKGRIAYRFTTRSLPVFTEFYKEFYINGKKQLPKHLDLNPLSMAVWFMDDGARSRSAYYLNTQQFSLSEQQMLQALLLRRFGLSKHTKSR